MYIKRERYLRKIRPFYDVDLIKVLTGVRRCGKSINFEDLQFEKIRTAEKLNSYVMEERNVLFRWHIIWRARKRLKESLVHLSQLVMHH